MRIKSLTAFAALLVLALPATVSQAQEEMSPEDAAMMEAWMKAGAPGEAHERLAGSEGSWKMTISSWMDPAAPPMVSQGASQQKMIFGGRILEQRAKSEMMGVPFEGIGMTGFDNTTGKYWSTWVDSLSTGVFVSEGEWDESLGALVFRGEMQDPMGGGVVPIRAVSREESADRHVFEWYETHGGQETKTMEIVYTRL